MKRELKKQIKENELQSGFEIAWNWLRSHEKVARTTLFAGLALLLIAGGLRFFTSKRDRDAQAAFEAAMATYETPVAGASQEPLPAGVTPFATSEDKHTRAAAAFDGVARAYPSHAVARRARYFAAVCRAQLGQAEVAGQALQSLASGAPGLETSLAKLALADLDRRSGALDKAVAAYGALVEDAAFALPRDHVLMTLAGALEEARRNSEAAASYRSLYERFPESSYAPEAQRRAAYLTPARS